LNRFTDNQNGGLTIKCIRKYGYNTLVESYLKKNYSCLKLIKVYRKMRIWEIQNSKSLKKEKKQKGGKNA